MATAGLTIALNVLYLHSTLKKLAVSGFSGTDVAIVLATRLCSTITHLLPNKAGLIVPHPPYWTPYDSVPSCADSELLGYTWAPGASAS